MGKGIGASDVAVNAAIEAYQEGATMYTAMQTFGISFKKFRSALSERGIPAREAKPRTGAHVTAPVKLFCPCGERRRIGQPLCASCRDRKLRMCSCKRPIEAGVRMGKPYCRICGREMVGSP